MKLLRPMLRKQSGQALPMALVLLALGAMIIVPTLVFTTTNLTATRVVDAKTRDLYAADAGVEQGLWKVEHNDLPLAMSGEWNETTYDTYELNPYTYSLYDSDDPDNTVTVNNRNVDVSITPVWPLQGLEVSSLPQERTPDPNDHVLTFGGLNGDGDYEISIFKDGTVDPLLVQRMGCWLPPGYDYVPDSSNLEQDPGQPYYCVPVRESHNGGWAITWTFPGGINYNNLPAQGSKRIVTFEFTPSEEPTDAFSWTRTSRPDFPLSWDTAKKVYEVESSAPSDSAKQTTIVAHSVKKEFQALGGALTGDYQATGNTLIRDTNSGTQRDRLYKETWTNIPPTTDPPTDPIPDDAIVEKIFLYWSGWKCKPWNPTEAELNGLPVNKHVNEVALKVKVGENEMPRTKVTATNTQVMRNTDAGDPHGWSYACFADVTNVVKNYFDGQGVHFYGNAQYTVGHWDIRTTYGATTYRYQLCNWKEPHNNECTAPPTVYYALYPLSSPRTGTYCHWGWPQGYHCHEYTYENEGGEDHWAYTAWSVVVIYSSPSTAGHHMYIYDEFRYCDHNETMEFTIKGFLAPQDVESYSDAARMTCFVGEGDNEWDDGDNLFLNDHLLNGDAINPVDNVWNSMSNVLGGTPTDNGIDIDTFTAGNGVIQHGDTEADIDISTGTDIWNLVYIILSFRSEITTGGMIDYHIE